MDIIKTFDNGLNLVIREMPGIYSAALTVMVNCGSSLETKETNGYSHFIEHMLFKGTKKRTALKISEEIENIGGQINAYTSKDVTCFYTKTAGNYIDRSFDLLSDMFFNSSFDAEEMEREKKVIIEEIIMGNDLPDDVCHDLIAEAIYGDNSLGRTITGPVENISNAHREDLIAFKNKYYSPCNVCVSVAGNINCEEIIKLTEKYFVEPFGKVKNDSKNILEPQETYAVYKKQIKNTEQCHICLGCKAAGIGQPENYPNSILSGILGGGMSSRLFQSLREKNGLCYSIFSYLSIYRNNGYFEIYVGTNPKNSEIAVTALRHECDKIKNDGITDEELNRGKEQYKGAMLLSLENSINVATLYGGFALRENKMLDIDERIKKTDAVTKDDVQKAAVRLLNPDNYSLAYVGKGIRKDLLKLFRA